MVAEKGLYSTRQERRKFDDAVDRGADVGERRCLIAAVIADRLMKIQQRPGGLTAAFEEYGHVPAESDADEIAMIQAHCNDYVRRIDELPGERAPPVRADIEIFLPQVVDNFRRYGLWTLVDAGGRHQQPRTRLERGAQCILGGQAAEDVARADEQNLPRQGRSSCRSSLGIKRHMA